MIRYRGSVLNNSYLQRNINLYEPSFSDFSQLFNLGGQVKELRLATTVKPAISIDTIKIAESYNSFSFNEKREVIVTTLHYSTGQPRCITEYYNYYKGIKKSQIWYDQNSNITRKETPIYDQFFSKIGATVYQNGTTNEKKYQVVRDGDKSTIETNWFLLVYHKDKLISRSNKSGQILLKNEYSDSGRLKRTFRYDKNNMPVGMKEYNTNNECVFIEATRYLKSGEISLNTKQEFNYSSGLLRRKLEQIDKNGTISENELEYFYNDEGDFHHSTVKHSGKDLKHLFIEYNMNRDIIRDVNSMEDHFFYDFKYDQVMNWTKKTEKFKSKEIFHLREIDYYS